MKHAAHAWRLPWTGRACALLALAAGPAAAVGPLVTETSDAVPDGTCQVEGRAVRERPRDEPVLNTWDLLLACGVTAKSELAVGVSGERAGPDRERGLRVVGKATLATLADGVSSLGLRYGLGAVQVPGQPWRHDSVELLGLFSRELAAGLSVHANVGHLYSRQAGRGTTLWSLGIESAGEHTLVADLFGEDRDHAPWVSLGWGMRWTERFSGYVNVAMQFGQPRVPSLALGAKVVF